MQLAIIRSITTIDADGDAAWRIIAASDESHTWRRLMAEWYELAAPAPVGGEGLGVTSPLLFIALGSTPSIRRQARLLLDDATAMLTRLASGASELADELAWLDRVLQRPGVRFNAEAWRALALRQLLAGDELAQPAHLTGQVDDGALLAFFAVPPDGNLDELEALAGRAIEAWLYLQTGGDATDEA